jgi:hypothetical protein
VITSIFDELRTSRYRGLCTVRGRRPKFHDREDGPRYAGRLEAEKGVDGLGSAAHGVSTLVLAGEGPLRPDGAISRGRSEPTQFRNLYAGGDVVGHPVGSHA